MKINELIQSFEVWTTNEEKELLKKLSKPIRLSNLKEEDQFRVEALIRKSLVTKIGMEDPTVVINDQTK
jgi:hypothetical protein